MSEHRRETDILVQKMVPILEHGAKGHGSRSSLHGFAFKEELA